MCPSEAQHGQSGDRLNLLDSRRRRHHCHCRLCWSVFTPTKHTAKLLLSHILMQHATCNMHCEND